MVRGKSVGEAPRGGIILGDSFTVYPHSPDGEPNLWTECWVNFLIKLGIAINGDNHPGDISNG